MNCFLVGNRCSIPPLFCEANSSVRGICLFLLSLTACTATSCTLPLDCGGSTPSGSISNFATNRLGDSLFLLPFSRFARRAPIDDSSGSTGERASVAFAHAEEIPSGTQIDYWKFASCAAEMISKFFDVQEIQRHTQLLNTAMTSSVGLFGGLRRSDLEKRLKERFQGALGDKSR